ncbi:MAG TPA: tetratricopeptide repeat protein, partial [Acidobacteriota bacterium]|nr:tetratricopeptide repeat protein [Acidobacteriota bacterium]
MWARFFILGGLTVTTFFPFSTQSHLCWVLAQSEIAPAQIDTSEKEITALCEQAKKLEAAGKYDEALPLVQKALAQAEQSVGSEHVLTARCLT